MDDISFEQKYMTRADLALEVANLVGIDSYDPSREAQGCADFRRDELEKIYQQITGESGEGLSQREMNHVMLDELGSELYSGYPYDLSRRDLKEIHRGLLERNREE